MSVLPDPYWPNRPDAMRDQILFARGLLEIASKAAPAGPPRAQTLDMLLKNFDAFGGYKFDYFHDRFANQTLTISPRYPDDFVYAVLLDQLGFDLRAIQQAVDQRLDPVATSLACSLPKPPLADAFTNSLAISQRQALDTADRLAMLALEYADMSRGLITGLGVVRGISICLDDEGCYRTVRLDQKGHIIKVLGTIEDTGYHDRLRLISYGSDDKPLGQNGGCNSLPQGKNFATALTYFQKSADIRLIPYAPVAFIGLPYSSLRSALDWLCIPHEVGHYVYWHAKLSNGTLFCKQLMDDLWPRLPDYIRAWVEEIFADVFSCLVAGPLVGWSGQALLGQQALDQFFGDDGVHPAPVLRPYIYHKVLARTLPLSGVAINAPGSLTALSAAWDVTLAARKQAAQDAGLACDEKYKATDGTTWRLIQDVIQPDAGPGQQPVDLVIDAILKYWLPANGPQSRDWAKCWIWAADQLGDTALGALQDGFGQWLDRLRQAADENPLPLIEVTGDYSNLWTEAASQQVPIAPEDWVKSLVMEGWATKWPGNVPHF